MVVDEYGVAVGMLFATGGQLGVPYQLAYVMPMEEMLGDIAEKVGRFLGTEADVEWL